MSDCSARAWERVDTVQVPSAYPADFVLKHVRFVDYGGYLLFERVRGCEMRETFRGVPNSDWTCSACGKVHNAPRANERCPRCGARVDRVFGLDGKEVPRR